MLDDHRYTIACVATGDVAYADTDEQARLAKRWLEIEAGRQGATATILDRGPISEEES